MTRSTVIGDIFPPPMSITAVTSFLPFCSESTVAAVRILIPCFSNSLRARAEISSSSSGRMRGSTSTTETCAPMS